MDKLIEAGSLEFEMVYHAANNQFEVIKMKNRKTKEVLGEATFTAITVPPRPATPEFCPKKH